MNLTSLAQKAAACGAVHKYLAVAVLSASVSILVFANAQPQKPSPGSQPFTPTRIDWLTTTLQASLRDESLQTGGFDLQITSSDPETVVIYVRYSTDVNRKAMNISMDAARKVIELTAKRYGWEKWVKVREDVQLLKEDGKS
jgi:hypothetical protein